MTVKYMVLAPCEINFIEKTGGPLLTSLIFTGDYPREAVENHDRFFGHIKDPPCRCKVCRKELFENCGCLLVIADLPKRGMKR